MNFLFVSGHNPYGSEPFGGAETSIRVIAEKLAERGHDVTYLTSKCLEDEQALAKERGVSLISFRINIFRKNTNIKALFYIDYLIEIFYIGILFRNPISMLSAIMLFCFNKKKQKC